MNRRAIILALCLLPPGIDAALAHGAKPQHGGVVTTAQDLSFELVAESNGASLYVVDHDKPADVAGYQGKLTVLNGSQKSEAALKPAGGNKLEAREVELVKGAKAAAVLQTPDKKTLTARFTVK